MAASQRPPPDLGGEATRGISLDTLHDYAHELLAFSSQVRATLDVRRDYVLPGLALRTFFALEQDAQLCDRAFCQATRHTGAGARSLALTVLDAESFPQAPRGVWRDGVPGLTQMLDALARHGLIGAHDAAFDLWQFFDPASGAAVQLGRAPGDLPPWEASFPLRLFLHWAGRSRHSALIHAGTLGAAGRGVLLAGHGGAGKSGTTLAGVLDGLSSVGDDYVVARNAGDRVTVHPILKTMKQDAAGLERLGLTPGDSIFAGPNWQGKYEFDFSALGRGPRVQALDVCAVLLPTIAGAQTTRLRRATSKDAMLAISRSSLYQLYGSWREDVQFIAALTRQLPAYRLELGEDPAEIAALVRRFLERGPQ